MAIEAGAVAALEKVLDLATPQTRPKDVRVPATVDSIDEDGTVWVVLAGASLPTPVASSTVAVERGDVVSVTVGRWRATIDGNESRLATDDAKATMAMERAVTASESAEVARAEAEAAHWAAESAVSDALVASLAAAQASADAETAREMAESAEDSALAALQSASSANTYAGAAYDAAQSAVSDAADAKSAAQAAQADAASAQADAASAKADATRANASANDALAQLSVVQDVVGVLDWASTHGTYSLTSDTAVQPGKMYFERTGSGTSADPYVYAPVAEPSDSGLSGYYELSVDEAMQAYIMSHLALTNEGLWVTKDGSGYKILLASTGMSVVDPQGHTVATFGENVTFSSSRPQYIGGEDAYIVYYDSDDDDVPDTVRIGGNVVLGGSKTLTEVLDEVGQASSDAATALQTAEDVPIVALSSTNGTVFKRNLGVSTTIVATIFTPGGRISTAAELHRRFGAGAYLEWGWRDSATAAEHTILSTDPRLSQGGFAFTVSPDEIDVQAVITCSLNY